MQGQDIQKTDNVVSLFNKREKSSTSDATQEPQQEAAPAKKESFQEVMDRNAKNKERLERERATANKSVLRSYRIKH
jgi:hypothetical protein